jgi:hypothetical protein
MSDDSLNINDLQGAPGAKFEKVGDEHAGTVLSIRRRQQTDFDTNEPLVWQDGSPRMQTVITIQPDDGGDPVALYLKGGKAEVAEGKGWSGEAALVKAAREAKVVRIDAGGHLTVAHTGIGRPSKKGLNGMKLYSCIYRPPASTQPISGLFSDDNDA